MKTEVLFQIVKGHTGLITINHAEQRNAASASFRRGLREFFERFEGDNTLRVADLTPAVEKAFCGGMSLNELSAGGLNVPPRNFLPVISDNTFISKPLIVAVNGIAYAYGWLFAQMCDLCISSGHATFSISEAKVGRGMLWTAPLTRMLPRRLVMELLLTGVPISAQRAYDFVYVNALVPVGQLRTEASRMASAIAEYVPLTVRAPVNSSTFQVRWAARRACLRHIIYQPVYQSEDAVDSPSAFAKKRSQRWSGRLIPPFDFRR